MSPRRRIKRPTSTYEKKAKKGFRGYPLATVAFYGPNSEFASKVAVGIVLGDSGEVAFLERWHARQIDVRRDRTISKEIAGFLKKHDVQSVALTDGIIGCPHEEGIDYPDGESCPECPYWKGRDRWTGEVIH